MSAPAHRHLASMGVLTRGNPGRDSSLRDNLRTLLFAGNDTTDHRDRPRLGALVIVLTRSRDELDALRIRVKPTRALTERRAWRGPK